MTDTRELLAEYIRSNSEMAFRELVERYLNLVYSAAIRLVEGDRHLAEDVAQTVFADLARMARSISPNAMLGGWLHRHTCFIAAKTLRRERRRQARERHAMEMNRADNADANIKSLAPILDEAINDLGVEDRAAILLRFFEQHDFRSVGAAMGSTEEAARKRVARALEKLRSLLQRRGVALSATAIGTALASEAVAVAPAGLAASISTTAFAGSAAAGGMASGVLKIIVMSKLKAGIIAAVLVGGIAIPLAVYQRTQIKLRQKDQDLRSQSDQLAQLAAENERLSNLLTARASSPGPRLPAPPFAAVTALPEPMTDGTKPPRLIARLMKGDAAPKLAAEQIDSYLKENHRTAASLLAAFRATGDAKLLEEAKEKFPNDPHVAFAAVFKKDAPPEERRRWIEAFKESAPDNALASYLSAIEHFKSGQLDQAVQELIAASGKSRFEDYSTDFVQNDEEAWRSSGYSVAESKTLASMLLVLPHLGQMKELSQDIVSLANSYRQAGDDASAREALQIALHLGERLDGSPGQALITQLVGMAVQRIALSAMDSDALDGSGRAVKDRIEDLGRQRAAVKELTSHFDSVQQRVSDQDWISYKDRWRSFGEYAALQWLISKYQ